MKICVYAIAKNEAKFVTRWINSMKEADEIYVLDTGSTDNTIKILKKNHINVVKKIINPWRFDIARNESLKLVPLDTDICVCTDLDEVFEKGWREKLELAWDSETTRARYNYNWSFSKEGKPEINFYIEKIHTRKNYFWTHPVHEVLQSTTKEKIITIDNITLNHYPDTTKSRSSYLPLLELSIKEDNKDDRNMHYLGREYMYYKQYDKAIYYLKKHLKLKTATWKDERAASMRFIARCYKNKQEYRKAKIWLTKAIKEAPHLRDAYVERGILEYELKNYKEVEKYLLKALQIKNHLKSYINEPFSWNETIPDLLSISYFYQKKYQLSLYFINEALKINSYDKRLLNNKELIQKKIDR